MKCKPLFVGKTIIGDRFDDGHVFVFFGNQTYSAKEAIRLFPERKLSFLKQVHGNSVVHVGSKDMTELTPADASVTSITNISLSIYTADCIAALIHDPSSRQIGAVHAGWRGIASNILSKSILELKSQSPNGIRVWLGPHIKTSSFEVHKDVAEQLLQSYPGKETVVFDHPTDNSKSLVDLTEIAVAQFLAQGLIKENIWVSPVDTFSDHNYYSYRRNGPTGRLISSITLLDSAD